MSLKWIIISIYFSTILFQTRAQEPIPEVVGSYKAIGEIVETVDNDTKYQNQIVFEESYDSETKDAVFRLWLQGTSITYVENYQTGQTFEYSNDDEGKQVCREMTVDEWIETDSPPQLLKYEDINGTVRFSLKQLFSLDDQYIKERAVPTDFRGVPAKMWQYEITGIDPDSNELTIVDVNAYWSDGSWNTTSNKKNVPLGYVVSKRDYKRESTGAQLHKQFINIYGFVPGAVDHKLFKPVQGTVCPNRKQTIKFPDISNLQTLSFRSELIFPEFEEIKYMDTWFDSQNKLLCVDMERIREQDAIFERINRKYQSEMVVGKLGIVYRLTHVDNSITCSIIPIEIFDFDVQDLINFKADFKDWSVGKLFGLNQTSYVYIGKTTKRDIPCHLFQGKRKDWPEPSAYVESLWEWCFSTSEVSKDNSIIFKNGEYGLISAQVKILNTTYFSGYSDYPPNFRIIHHFYDVKSEDPKLMDATNFDISNCFQETEKRRLQFGVVYKGLIVEESVEEMENLTSDIRFLVSFKNAIYKYSTLNPASLRVTDVKAMVQNKKLFLKFTLLAPHKDLPDEIKENEISISDAENKLKQVIDNNMFFINYIVKPGKEVQFHANSQSLRPQLNDTFIPHVLPPIKPSPSSATTTFTLIDEENGETTTAETDHVSSSTSNGKSTTPEATTPKHGKPGIVPQRELLESDKYLHKKETIAGVSIMMLIIGISIGSALIFVMYNGVPKCLKCTKT